MFEWLRKQDAISAQDESLLSEASSRPQSDASGSTDASRPPGEQPGDTRDNAGQHTGGISSDAAHARFLEREGDLPHGRPDPTEPPGIGLVGKRETPTSTDGLQASGQRGIWGEQFPTPHESSADLDPGQPPQAGAETLRTPQCVTPHDAKAELPTGQFRAELRAVGDRTKQDAESDAAASGPEGGLFDGEELIEPAESEDIASELADVPRRPPRRRGRRFVPGASTTASASRAGQGGDPGTQAAGKTPGQSAPQGSRLTSFTPSQRLLILDSWKRSGLPAGDFAPLVGISAHTLYTWKRLFETQGPEGLVDKPRGAKEGTRVSEVTRRTILMLKEANPEYGCERIGQMLARGPGLAASAGTVARVLREAGYEVVASPTRPHPDQVRRFERARPNQLWQTDLFTFVLKRQNRRVYLVAFLDDHSRFITCYGLHASQSTALVLEVLRAGLASYGAPEEILTDNGAQYVTWRGTSQFSKECEKRGIRQIVASPRRPQTLGKIERFWGTLWRECVEAAIFTDLEDARRRIGLFMDHYNFSRVHLGIGGLVPADRFFGAAPEVLRTLKARVAANSLELARHGIPKEPFYLTGQVAGKSFSLHAEGERVILRREGEERQEVELVAPPANPPAAPATATGLPPVSGTPTSSTPPQLAAEGANKPEVPGSEAEAAAATGSAVQLPEPLCPQGLAADGLVSSTEQPPEPGTSPLDERFPFDEGRGAGEQNGGES